MAIALVIALVIAAIPFGLAAYVASLVNDLDESPDNFYFEVAKHLLQLAIVIIFGGFVTYLLKEAGEIRQNEREEQRQRLQEERDGAEKIRQEERADAAQIRQEERAEADRKWQLTLIKEQEKQEQSLREAEKRQEQAQARAVIRVDYLTRLGSAYRSVKAARRALRAGGLTSRYDDYMPDTITDYLAQVYCDEMKRVNDAQLVLEALKIEASSLPAFVALSDVKDKLETMEDYLRDVLWEYEKASALRISGKPVVFGDLKKLEEFTGATKRTLAPERHRFKDHFADPYDKVVEAISKQLH
jgi:hypothetical protein